MRQIQAKSNGNWNGHARTVSLKSLKPDPKNANVGTERGSALLEKSLREYGAGRSILLDNHEGNVYDPFLGSGTTLCAAEQSKRTCYALEIEPKYVAVALQRMADMGLSPKLAKGESKA